MSRTADATLWFFECNVPFIAKDFQAITMSLFFLTRSKNMPAEPSPLALQVCDNNNNNIIIIEYLYRITLQYRVLLSTGSC